MQLSLSASPVTWLAFAIFYIVADEDDEMDKLASSYRS
jgi:hypothetical protein